MRSIFTISLFLIFCGITAFIDEFGQFGIEHKKKYISNEKSIITKEGESVPTSASYEIDAELNVVDMKITVKEKIVWKNNTDYETDELFFHLYANGFKNNNTFIAERYDITSESETELRITSTKINSVESELIYLTDEIGNEYDSTVAKIKLDHFVTKGDTVIIEFLYSMKIPRTLLRMGYATGRNFISVAQWYPKLGVYEKGNWICNPYYANTNFYSDFADYYVELNVPADYTVASTGFAYADSVKKDYTKYFITQKGVHDFVWLATDEIEVYEDVITRTDSSSFLLKLFLQPENEKYAERYIKAIKTAVDFCEKNFGAYPYRTLTCVDVPRTSQLGGMEYPTLFAVRTDLFSREATLRLEELAIHEFVHQYFQGIVANNEVYEAWLDEGITTYLTTKILTEYYGDSFVTFRFLEFLDIEGVNFLTFSDIPLIYTLGDYKHPEGYNSYYSYYKSKSIGAIADSSHKLPTALAYYVNSYHKSELMFLSLERIIGKEKLLSIIADYYKEFKFAHPSGEDFINCLKNSVDTDLDWFLNDCFYSDAVFDYAITSVKRKAGNKFEVIAERFGDGVFQNEIAFYTEVARSISGFESGSAGRLR